ncbi:MAG: ATP synthase F1 subunit gamma [Candidatus Omnitrophota bacterium]|nr:ATP synthase F1 subunit gamma [Candidatus Omnitrophota bacterium]
MATLREIKQKIGSIGKIGRVTNALEIVSLNRIKKIESVTLNCRFYFEKIREVVFGVADNVIYQSHPLLEKRDIKTTGLIVVASDKGLCGGFNSSIFEKFREFTSSEDLKIKLVCFGRKGANFFKSGNKTELLRCFNSSIKKEPLADCREIALELSGMFIDKKIDSLHIIYNKFRTHLLGKAVVAQLLPVGLERQKKIKRVRDYRYEPSVGDVLDGLLKEYLVSQIYQTILESNTAEEMARMFAMKQASDNAKEIIDRLILNYHKTRQAVITKEILDIMAASNL